jgi:hypothetical protein
VRKILDGQGKKLKENKSDFMDVIQGGERSGK